MGNFFKNRSIDQTRGFYDGLASGRNRRGLWGKKNRFDPDSISSNPSILRNFVPVISRFLTPKDHCLDLGCGPGGFLSLMAPLCESITGADITPSFVRECQAMIDRKAILNARTVLLESNVLPFKDNEFDKVIMIDTIHHLEQQDKTLGEVARVLKPGGLFLFFEPNKLNPLLILLCAFDKNEHGFLQMGTFDSYRRLLGSAFRTESEEYNGMLIGPKSRILVALADFVSKPDHRALAWLSPKLFVAARKVC